MNSEPRLSPFMRTIALIVALLVPLGTAPVSLQAATYYWDSNDTASLGGTAGGTWSTTTVGTTTMGWSTDSTGATVVSGNNVATNTGDTINFGTSTASSLLAGTITVSGTVSAGNINFASGSGAIVLSGGTINLAAAETITVDNTTDTINSVLAGAGTSFTKAGTGTLILGGSNTFSGSTTVSAGGLTLTNALALQNSALVTTSGTTTLSGVTTLTLGGLSGATGDLGSANVLNGYTGAITALTLNPQTGVSVTYGGVVSNGSGNMTLTKTGAGTQILTGANTYTGTTTISGGTLQIGNGTTGSLIGAGTAATFNGALTFTGTGTINFNEAAGVAQGMGLLTLTAGQGTVQSTWAGSSTNSLTFSNVTARSAGASVNFFQNLGNNGTDNSIILTQYNGSNTVAGALIDRGVFFNGSAYATANAASGYLRAYGSGDANYLAASGTAMATGSTNNVDLTSSLSAQTAASANTINMHNFSIAMTGTSTLLQANGILSSGSSSATIGGGTTPLLSAATPNAEMVIRVDGSSDVLTVNSAIQVNGSGNRLTKSGAGTLVLTVANTYTGITAINSGTLQLGNGGTTGSIGSSASIVNNGSLFINNTGTFTIPAISGTGSVTNSGAALTLNSGNTFSGGFTLNSGSVNAITGAYAGFGAGKVTLAGGTLNLSGTASIANDVDFNVANLLVGSGNTLTFGGTATLKQNLTITSTSATNDTSLVFNGPVGQSGGSFGFTRAVTGGTSAGTTFNAVNTFTGDITINSAGTSGGHARTLTIGSSGSLNSGDYSGNITNGNATGSINYSSSADQILRGVITTSNTLIKDTSSTSKLTLAGGASNAITGLTTVNAGTLELNKSGAFTAIQNGGLTINTGGTVQYNASAGTNQIGDASTVTVAGGTFNMNGIADTLGSLVYQSGTVTTSAGLVTLANATATALSMRSGSIGSSFALSSVTTSGVGVTFDATNNGTATISGGLNINSSATAAITRTFTVNNGTAAIDMDITGAITNTTSTALTLTGGGTLQLSGTNSNTYGGLTTVSAGSLLLNKSSTANAIAGGGLTINAGTVQYTATAGSDQIGNTSVVTVAGGTFDMNSISDTLGSLVYQSGTISNVVNPLTLANASLTALSMRNTTIAFNVALSNVATSGVGVTFDAASNGTATISGGIDLNSSATTGVTRTFTVNNGAAAIDMDITGVISNTTATGLTLTGGGTLRLSNTNTYTGTTTVSAGSLILSGSGTLGATTAPLSIGAATLDLGTLTTPTVGAVTITGAGTIQNGSLTGTSYADSNAAGTATISANLLGSSVTFTKSGAGTTILSGSNTYTGATAVSAGTLNLTGSLTGSNISTSGTGILTQSAAGTINGAGVTFTQGSSGTTTLSGSNTYTGATAVNAGTLLVTGLLASGSAVTVAALATLGGSGGTIGGTVNVATNGILSPGTSFGAVGTLTLTNSGNALTLNGGTGGLYFDVVGAGTSDQIAITNGTGNLVVNGTNKVFLNAPAAGIAASTNIDLITYATKSGGSLVFANGSTTMGNLTLVTNGTLKAQLQVGAGGLNQSVWIGGVNSNWDTSTGNWTKNTIASQAFSANDFVTFDDTTGGAGKYTVANTGSMSPGLVTVNNSTNAYVMNAIIGGSAAIIKNGSNALTLGNTNTFTGGLILNAGTLNVNVSQGFSGGITVNGGDLRPATNASTLLGSNVVTFAGSASVNSGGASGTFVIPSVVINSGATATFGAIGGASATYTLTNGLSGSGNLRFTGGTTGGGNGKVLTLNDASGFTGDLRLDYSIASTGTIKLEFSGLGDGGKIIWGGAGSQAQDLPINVTGTGITFNTRQLELAGNRTVTLNSNGSGPLVFGTALSVAATGAKTLTLGGTTAGLNNTFGGVIADGTGAFAGTQIAVTKAADTSTWILSNTNTYTGNTTVSGGTLQIGAGSTTGSLSTSSAISVASGATLRFNRTNPIIQGTDFVSTISGAGGVTMNGTGGTLVLSGTNGYTGNTTVSAGILRLDSLTAISNSPLDTSGAGTVSLNAGAGTYTLGGLAGSTNLSSVITGTPTNLTQLVLNPGTGLTPSYSGIIGDLSTGMSVRKTGVGLQTLSGTNTFTGGLAVSAGTLRITTAQSFTGGVTLSGGFFGDATDAISAAELNNNSVTVTGTAAMAIANGETLTSSSGIAINSGSFTLAAISGGAATVNGVISGTGTLVMGDSNGAGQGNTLTLANTANTFTGVIQFNNSTNGGYVLNVNSLVDSASSGAGNIVMGNGGVISQQTFALNSGAIAPLTITNRQFDLQTTATGQLLKIANNSAQAFTINSNLLVSGTSASKTLTLGGTGTGLSTFAGIIGNGNVTNLALTKADASNIWILSGSNTYSGKTTISAGTLSINSIQNAGSATANALGTPAAGANSIIDLASTGTLRYTGTGHSSDRVINLTTTAGGTFTLDSSGASGTFALSGGVTTAGTGATTSTVALTGTGLGSESGSIVNGAAGNVTAITKSNIGTWVLSGSSSYTGTTTVNSGRLNLTGSLGATSALAMGGGTFGVTPSAASQTMASLTASSVGSNIVVGASKTLAITSGTFAPGNWVQINFDLSASGSAITLPFATKDVALSNLNTSVTVLDSTGFGLAAVNPSNQIYRLTSTATVPLLLASGNIATNYQVDNHIGTDAGSNALTVTAAVTQPTSITVDTSARSGVLTLGSGVTLKTNEWNFGGTNVNNTYKITGGTGIGNSNNNLMTISNYGGTVTIESPILVNGTGSYQFAGTGTTVLTGANTIGSGNTAGNSSIVIGGSGTLQIAGTGSLNALNSSVYNSNIAINSSTTFQYSSSTSQTLSGIVSGTGALTKDTNTSTLTLSNTNTYTGNTTISAGTLSLTGALTGGTAISTSGTGILNQSAAGVISGSSTLAQGSSGTSILAGTNTYTGSTAISAGTLAVNSAGSINTSSGVSIGAGNFNYNSSTALTRNITFSGTGGTLSGSGTINTPVTVTSGNTIAPGNSPGTLTFSNANLVWSSGGNYNWQVVDATTTPTAGTSHDTVSITGTGVLDLSGLTSSSRFNINLWSLSSTGPDVNGNAINWNNLQSHTWTLVSTAQTITTPIGGFNTNLFNINTGITNNTAGFTNTLSGAFTVATADSGTDLVLQYTPGNNPATGSLTITGASRVLAGTSNNIGGTLSNTASSPANALTIALTSTGTTTVGSITPSSGTVAQGGSTSVGGSYTAGTAGTTNSMQLTNTDGSASPTTAVSNTLTSTSVNQRSFNVGTTPIALGRFLVGATPTGTTAISSTGLNNVTANASLGSFSGTNTGSLTLTTGDSTAFNGGSTSQTANYSIGGSVATAGALSSASFSSAVTAELGSISNVVVGITGNALSTRTVNAPSTTTLGNYHAGAAVSVTSNAFGYTYGSGGGDGSHANTEDTTVQAYAGSADANGITLTGGANAISSAATFTRTFSGTAAISSSSGSFSSTVNPELSAATSVNAGYSIGVYSGQMIWRVGGNGSWGTNAKWQDSNVNGIDFAPGLDAGFTGVDSATFGNSTGSVTVSLNGSSPNLNAITFNNNGSYTLAQGSSGSITLAGTSPSIGVTGTHEISAPVTMASNTSITSNSSSQLTVSGIIGQSGGNRTLTKLGVGDLVLSNTNTYSGATNINGGALKISDLRNIGDNSATNTVGIAGGTLESTGNTYALGTNRSIVLGAGGGTIKTDADTLTVDGTVNNAGNLLSVDGAGNTNLSGIISGNGGLTKSGAGAATLSATNTYTGTTTLSAGTLNLNNTAAVGTGTFAINGGTIDTTNATAGLSANNNAQSWGGNFTFAGTSNFDLGTGAVNFGNTVGGARSITVTANTLRVGGVIANGTNGTPTTGLTKLGNGTLELYGSASNTYSGTTTVSSGTLLLNKNTPGIAIAGNLLINGGIVKLLQNEQIANTSTITQTSGTLNLNGKTETVVSYNKTGGTFLTGRGGSLIGTGSTFTYDGAGTNAIEVESTIADAHVVLTNGATVDVYGANAPFDGGSPGSSGGTLQVNSGGTGLEMNGSAGNTINLASDTNSTNAGRLVLSGDLTTAGTGLNTIASTGAGATKGYIDIGSSGSRVFTVGDTAAGTDLAISATIVGSAGLTKAGAGLMSLTAANTYTGTTTLNAGTINLGVAESAGVSGPLGNQAANAAGSIVLGGGTLQYSASNQNDYSGRFSTAASQAYNVDTNSQNVTWATALTSSGGTLSKSGAGTLTLTNTNTYSGATTISGGTLQIGNGGTTGSLSSSSAITNNGTLKFNRSNTVTQGTDFASVIGGTGAVTQAGSGNLVLNGTNTYTGATTVSSGTLQVGVAGAGSTHASSTITVTSASFSSTTGSGVNANNDAVSGQTVVTGAPVLAGSGTINGSVVIGINGSSKGILQPGDSAGSANGRLNIGTNLTVNAGSQLQLGLTQSFRVDPSFNWFAGTGGSSALDYLTSGGVTNIASSTVYNTYWGVNSIATLGTDFNYDTIKIGGTLTMDASGAPNYPTVYATDNGLIAGTTYTYGSIFKLLDWNGVGFQSPGSMGGNFNSNLPGSLVLPTLGAGYSWDTSALGSFGVVVVIPEPGRLMLMCFGLAALFLRRRRNR